MKLAEHLIDRYLAEEDQTSEILDPDIFYRVIASEFVIGDQTFHKGDEIKLVPAGEEYGTDFRVTRKDGDPHGVLVSKDAAEKAFEKEYSVTPIKQKGQG